MRVFDSTLPPGWAEGAKDATENADNLFAARYH